jgi:hypothetical protein
MPFTELFNDFRSKVAYTYRYGELYPPLTMTSSGIIISYHSGVAY